MKKRPYKMLYHQRPCRVHGKKYRALMVMNRRFWNAVDELIEKRKEW